MARTQLSLKALEVFLAIARRGALREAAADLGISASTASHHLSELERIVGRALFDHGHRPLRLTTAGEVLRARAEEAMTSLDQGLAELWSEDLTRIGRHLRVALIEDFDADVGPALAEQLTRALPRCDLSVLSRPSHEIFELMTSDQLDLAVASTTDRPVGGLREIPLLRDPFLMVLPADPDLPESLADLRARADTVPFLRYSRQQLFGRRIEAQLRRMGHDFPRRMEFETTHVILSLIAAGRGWTITTALSYARARRYHGALRVLPFPGRAFARHVSLYLRPDVPVPVADMARDVVRRSLRSMVISPMVAATPWLAGAFDLIDPPVSAGS